MLCHQINLPRPSSFWLIINPSPLFSLSTNIDTPLSSPNRPTSSTHTTPFSIAYMRCSHRTKSLPYASTPPCSPYLRGPPPPTPHHLLPTFLQPSQPTRPLLYSDLTMASTLLVESPVSGLEPGHHPSPLESVYEAEVKFSPKNCNKKFTITRFFSK